LKALGGIILPGFAIFGVGRVTNSSIFPDIRGESVFLIIPKRGNILLYIIISLVASIAVGIKLSLLT